MKATVALRKPVLREFDRLFSEAKKYSAISELEMDFPTETHHLRLKECSQIWLREECWKGVNVGL